MKAGLLVASPHMISPFFGRSVIIMCDHGPNGSMGLIINRPLDIQLGSVLAQLNLDQNSAISIPVLWGGPVMQEAGFLLIRGTVPADEELLMEITRSLFVSSSRTLLEKAAQGQLCEPFYLCLGYSGWGPGQLEKEIGKGTWLVADLSEEVLFSTPMEDRWKRAIESLGLATHEVWMNNPIEE